jgi:hypothetical protein
LYGSAREAINDGRPYRNSQDSQVTGVLTTVGEARIMKPRRLLGYWSKKRKNMRLTRWHAIAGVILTTFVSVSASTSGSQPHGRFMVLPRIQRGGHCYQL